jgi:hypothetical protein
MKREEDGKMIPLKKSQIFGTDIDQVSVDSAIFNLKQFPNDIFKESL